MIRLDRGCEEGSDEHFASLNGDPNGLLFAVSENLENISTFSSDKRHNRSTIFVLFEAEHLNRFPRLKEAEMELWEIRNTANYKQTAHSFSRKTAGNISVGSQ